MKMNRILIFFTAAVIMTGTALPAGAAVEFRASGHMHLNFSLLDNAEDAKFDADTPEDNFIVAQRFRPKLTMMADGVTAVFEAQQNQAIWGSDWPIGGNPDISGGDSGAIRIREAYVDFKLPATPVSLKVGYQFISLPSIWGHPVLDDRAGGVTAEIPFNDNISLAAFWARPERVAANPAATPPVAASRADIGGAMLPLSFGGASVIPYAAYYDSTPATVIIGGAHAELMPVDALSIKADLFATSHSSDIEGEKDLGTGFMIAAAVDYELPWGTPGAFLWYASGEDKNGEGALFGISTEGFGPSSWGFAGGNTFAYDSQISDTGISTCAIGVQLADVSCVDSLKHTVRVLYARGTADKSRPDVLTTEDAFIETNLDSTWSIYENLSAIVELGAIFPDFEDDADPALKAQLTLRFSF